jgi:hypothetical protein
MAQQDKGLAEQAQLITANYHFYMTNFSPGSTTFTQKHLHLTNDRIEHYSVSQHKASSESVIANRLCIVRVHCIGAKLWYMEGTR